MEICAFVLKPQPSHSAKPKERCATFNPKYQKVQLILKNSKSLLLKGNGQGIKFKREVRENFRTLES